MQTLPDNDSDKKDHPAPGKVLHAIGLMSGTSMDGIDVAVIDTDGTRVYKRGAFATYPYVPALRKKLAAMAGHKPEADDNVADVVRDVTDAHADAVEDFCARAGLDLKDIDVVGFHGQTVFHDPANAITCQLGDGARLANRLGTCVVNDFRAADVAAGGEGAPFAPLYHAALAQPIEPPVCVLNLGGVGNVTWISPDGGIVAFDTGPANALVDDWVEKMTGTGYDKDGALARTGTIDEGRIERALDNPWFDRMPPKPLERAEFAAASLAATDGLSAPDGAALYALTGNGIASFTLLPAQ